MSTPTNFDVTPEMIREVASQCQQVSDEILQHLGTLTNYVTSFDGIWIGKANTAFSNLTTDFATCTQRLTTALTGISAGLTANANNYEEGEQVNSSSVTSINSALPSVNW